MVGCGSEDVHLNKATTSTRGGSEMSGNEHKCLFFVRSAGVVLIGINLPCRRLQSTEIDQSRIAAGSAPEPSRQLLVHTSLDP